MGALALAGFRPSFITAAQTLHIKYRKPVPYVAALDRIDPSADEFECEKVAVVIEAAHEKLLENRTLPLASNFSGKSPLAVYKRVADGIFEGHFGDGDFNKGLTEWIASLGNIRRARFFALPDGIVRYEIASVDDEGIAYRVGLWRETWNSGKLERFEPVSEQLTRSKAPLFRDVTGHSLGETSSFQQQLRKGNTFWRSRLDLATGIDVYGNNGIAVGDIDGDGRDEVYVCQPGGLPNRLYKVGADGTFEDITEHTGLAILDDTTCALFVDFRNLGRQDLVVLRSSGPLLFLNDGSGRFRLSDKSFRFRTPPQGSFTGMAAADYDRDGRVDLYLCCYVYFQSEDQYRYPAPYHDARNGPPNFLFRNRIEEDGSGFFEDVTEASGMNHNNDRYSFAPAWCDFDGDGWPDLYVANDFGAKNLYRNRKGQFRDEANELGVSDVGPGMSAAWFDYDGDGRPDLLVSNMWSSRGQRISRDPAFGLGRDMPRAAYERHSKGNSLYRNRGNHFEDAGRAEGVEMGRWAWSSGGFDFDNDGTPEIFVTCGMLTNESKLDLDSFFWRQVVAKSPVKLESAPEYENGWNCLNQLIREGKSWSGREPNVFYARPEGASRYYDFSGVSGLDFEEDGRAFAATDLDGDGNLDLVLKSRLGPQVRALQNCCGTHRESVVIRLRGTRSNRDAIGALVEIAGQVKFVEAGSGYLSQHTKDLHFALKQGAPAEGRVKWPSGTEQHFQIAAAGWRYRVTEGVAEPERERLAPRREWPEVRVEGENASSMSATWLFDPVPLPDKRNGPGFVLLTWGREDPMPAGVPVERVDLSGEPDVAASYAIFRHYLFDLRTDLTTPTLFLIDDQSRAHRVYSAIPDSETLKSDLERMGDPTLGLPFPGDFYKAPSRNFYKLGAAFYQAGYPDQSLPYLYETTSRNPENWKAWLAIGQLHAEAGRNKDAVGAFERVIALQPNASSALLYAGECEVKLGNREGGESFLKRSLDADPSNADAANQLGLVMAQTDRPDEARRYFEEAISLRPDHDIAINNLGVLYMNQGKVSDAIAAFQYGIRVAPDDDKLYINLGRVYVAAGDRGKAKVIMQKLLERKPNDPTALHALEELNAK